MAYRFESGAGYLNDLLLQVRTKENMLLSDDEYVTSMMDAMMDKYPQIVGYTWERMDDEFINILLWGDIRE
jgi:hypothetical protein